MRKIEWRALAWLPNYEISECGEVRRIDKMHGRPAGYVHRGHVRDGYLRFTLRVAFGKRTLLAHRLVCEAFHGPAPSDAYEVAHWDGNGLNNNFRNLRWATTTENWQDRRRHGRAMGGSLKPGAKLSEDAVRAARAMYTHRHGEIAKIARQFSVSHSSMRRVIRGLGWRHV